MPMVPMLLFCLCGAAPHFPLSRRHEARASPIKEFDLVLDHFILSKQMTLYTSQNEVFADKSQTLTVVRVGGGRGIPVKPEHRQYYIAP